MKAQGDYKLDQSFALLLIGAPKAGKTSFAMSFPDPYILDCDSNLAGALRHHKHAQKNFNFWFDNPIDEPDAAKRWLFCAKKLREAVASPEPRTIIVDGLSLMGIYLEAHILANSSNGNGMKDLTIAGVKVMNQAQWGPFKKLMTDLVMAAKMSGKLFIMTCHEHTELSDSGAVLKYVPLISGSLRSNIAGFFTDVWRCETTSGPTGVKYSVRFHPKSLMQIGNSLSIAEKDFDTTNKSREDIQKFLSKYLGF